MQKESYHISLWWICRTESNHARHLNTVFNYRKSNIARNSNQTIHSEFWMLCLLVIRPHSFVCIFSDTRLSGHICPEVPVCCWNTPLQAGVALQTDPVSPKAPGSLHVTLWSPRTHDPPGAACRLCTRPVECFRNWSSVQMGPALSEYGQPEFPLNSKSLSPISTMLICPLNLKFDLFERILLGDSFSD